MNAKYRTVPAEFGPETRFEIKPVVPAPFRALEESRFERLKNRLVAERLKNTGEPELGSRVRRAANEAAALAWVTPYPLLVFPVLFEEKEALECLRAARQDSVRRRSCELLVV